MIGFKTATLIAAIALLAAGIVFPAPMSWWLCGLVLACYAIVFGLGVSRIRSCFFVDALCRIRTNNREVVLTFDDGPDPLTTPSVLDTLRLHDVKAAFFCIGKQVQAHPELARRIHDEGHLVGNHSFRHRWWTNFLFGRGLESEFKDAQTAIEDAVGLRPVYCRSPMGLTNPHYGSMLRQLGLRLVGWDVRAFDRRGPTVEAVVERVASRARPGSIIVLHDAGTPGDFIVAVLDGIIARLRADGYTFVQIDEGRGDGKT